MGGLFSEVERKEIVTAAFRQVILLLTQDEHRSCFGKGVAMLIDLDPQMSWTLQSKNDCIICCKIGFGLIT